MKLIACPLLVALLAAPALSAGEPSGSEKEVWSMEDAYWRYVRADDLDRYRTLWSAQFLGWPLSSPEPVRKPHITDWITAHTLAGEKLGSYEMERLAAQASGDYVTVTYRVRMHWVGKDGADKPGSLRVLHTWRHEAGGPWQIISGMSAPPDAQGH